VVKMGMYQGGNLAGGQRQVSGGHSICIIIVDWVYSNKRT